MSRKGGKKQMKPYGMSRALKLPRKSSPWVSKPQPGPHPAGLSIPLRLLVRDYLGLARTAREADHVIAEGVLKVDGKVRREPRYSAGFMDVVDVPSSNRSYRVLVDYRGRLTLSEVPGGESALKLCKVGRKQVLKGKRVQLTLHDGKNVVGDFGSFRPGDTVKITLPDWKVAERFPMEQGSLAYITGGKNTGKVGRIDQIRVMKGRQPNVVVLKAGDSVLEAPQRYVFVVGKEKPEITIPGVGT